MSPTSHRLVLALMLATGAGLAGCGSQTNEPAHAAEASAAPRDAHALVAAGATLLDVRTRAEYDERHLEGALLVPVNEVEARLAEIRTDRPVVVYCRSGARAERAATVLRRSGYDVEVLGSIDAW